MLKYPGGMICFNISWKQHIYRYLKVDHLPKTNIHIQLWHDITPYVQLLEQFSSVKIIIVC